MSGIFYSECSVPLFMMDNQNVVRRCGRLSGFISAIFFTIFLVQVIGRIIFLANYV